MYIKRYSTGISIFLIGLNLFCSCGTAINGEYEYTGEKDGSFNPEKQKTSIRLIGENGILLIEKNTNTNKPSERVGDYQFSNDSSIIITKFYDSLPPFSMGFQKGALTWQIVDSTAIYDKVISKFEKQRLSDQARK